MFTPSCRTVCQPYSIESLSMINTLTQPDKSALLTILVTNPSITAKLPFIQTDTSLSNFRLVLNRDTEMNKSTQPSIISIIEFVTFKRTPENIKTANTKQMQDVILQIFSVDFLLHTKFLDICSISFSVGFLNFVISNSFFIIFPFEKTGLAGFPFSEFDYPGTGRQVTSDIPREPGVCKASWTFVRIRLVLHKHALSTIFAKRFLSRHTNRYNAFLHPSTFS